MKLAEIMDFEHVIEVTEDGAVKDAPSDVYAPEVYDGQVEGNYWRLMTGYTHQYGYSGPVMHDSEYIGGTLAADILATPGYYVAVPHTYLNDEDDDEPITEGWVIAYHDTSGE